MQQGKWQSWAVTQVCRAWAHALSAVFPWYGFISLFGVPRSFAIYKKKELEHKPRLNHLVR